MPFFLIEDVHVYDQWREKDYYLNYVVSEIISKQDYHKGQEDILERLIENIKEQCVGSVSRERELIQG